MHVDLEQAAGVVGETAAHLDRPRPAAQHGHADRAELDVLAHVARLALVDVEFDLRLVVAGGDIAIHPAGGYRRVAFDDGREHARPLPAPAVGNGVVHAQREGAHVGQPDLVERRVARLETGLHRRAERDRVVGMDGGIGEAPEHAGDRAAHHGHARAPADQHHLAQGVDADAAVAQRTQHGIAQAGDQRLAPRLELGGRHLRLDPAIVPGQREGRGALVGQRAAAAFGGVAQPLAQVGGVGPGQRAVGLEARHGELHQRLVEVLAAQPVVAGAGAHLDDAREHLHDRNVEGAPAQVEHEKRLALLARFDAVGERGGGRLVDQAFHGQPGELPGALGRLALAIVEISGNGDHRAGDGLAQMRFRVGLERGEHERRQFLRREVAGAQPRGLARAHVALEGGGGQRGMRHLSVARGHADEQRAGVADADRRRREQVAERGGDELGAPVAPHGDRAVGGSQIYADDHALPPAPRGLVARARTSRQIAGAPRRARFRTRSGRSGARRR